MGDAKEIHIATERVNGSTRGVLPIWVVRVGDELYVRSYRGTAGGWYRHVIHRPYAQITIAGIQHRVTFELADPSSRAAVDRSYQTKYGRSGPAVAMVSDGSAATTMRLVPADPF